MTMLSRLIDRLEREASRFEPLFAAEAAIRALVVQRASIDLAQTVNAALDGALSTIERPTAATPRREAARGRRDDAPVAAVRKTRERPSRARATEPSSSPQSELRAADLESNTAHRQAPFTRPEVAVRPRSLPSAIAVASRRLPLPFAAGDVARAANLGDLVTRTPGGRMAAVTPMPAAFTARRDEAASAVRQPIGRLDAPPPVPPAGEHPSAPQPAGHTLEPAVTARAPHDLRDRKAAPSVSAGIAGPVSTDAPRHLPLPTAAGAARLPGSLSPTSPGESGGELARLAAWWQEREGAAPARVSMEPTASPVQPVPVTRASIEHAAADPLTSDLENLDLFAQALERVLAREARRHGVPLGDQP